MRKSTFFTLLLLLVAANGFASTWSREDRSEFEKANQAYRQSHFDEAITAYETLLQDYPRSSTLYYDLGNAYFRVKKIGPAILAYERALFYEPRNADVRENLKYVRGLLEYRIQDKRNWYVQAAEYLINSFTKEEVSFLGLGIYLIFIASWLVILIFKRGAPWGWWRKALLILSAIFIVLAAVKHLQPQLVADAIVTSREAEVRYGPSDSDQLAFRLGEGLKAYVVDRREGWSRILIVNGDSGWIKSDQITEVAGKNLPS